MCGNAHFAILTRLSHSRRGFPAHSRLWPQSKGRTGIVQCSSPAFEFFTVITGAPETRALARTRGPSSTPGPGVTRLRSEHGQREARDSQPARFFKDSHRNPDTQPD